MTSKSTNIKQIKYFLELEQLFYETKQKLLHLYLKRNDLKYIEACNNLDDFRQAVTQDFYTYMKFDDSRNIEDSELSFSIIRSSIENLYISYERYNI